MGYDEYEIKVDEVELTVVGITPSSDISTVDRSSEHVSHNLEGTVNMYGTAGGNNAARRL